MSIEPSSQALVIGVSKYQHVASIPKNRDAQEVRDVLASPSYCAYPPERVTLLEEAAATRSGILRELDILCDRARQKGSRTFLYFSGHGGQGADGSSYLLPFDARKEQYPSTAISARELDRYLDRCSGEVTVVLDCCYAAGMVGGQRDLALAGFGDSLRNDLQARGRVVFAASRADALAFGSLEAPHGIFTGHMLDGLRGKASTDGGNVNVQQLFNYVAKHVPFSSGEMQRPSFIAHVESFYDLTRYPRRITPSPVFEKDVYVSYDREDVVLQDWVTRELQPGLERNGCSVWDYDDIGYGKLELVKEAIKKSKYTVVLLTEPYLRSRLEELKTSMAILQAAHTRTPRFIPILREPCDLPLDIEAFVSLDMSKGNQMRFQSEMKRLITRLKKEPHLR